MRLDARIAELVAVGSAVGAKCRPCLEFHTGKAGEAGGDAETIAEAVETGRMVRRSAAAQFDRLTVGAEASPGAPAPGRGCC